MEKTRAKSANPICVGSSQSNSFWWRRESGATRSSSELYSWSRHCWGQSSEHHRSLGQCLSASFNKELDSDLQGRLLPFVQRVPGLRLSDGTLDGKDNYTEIIGLWWKVSEPLKPILDYKNQRAAYGNHVGWGVALQRWSLDMFWSHHNESLFRARRRTQGEGVKWFDGSQSNECKCDCYRKPSLTLFVFCFLLLLFSVIIALSSFVLLAIVLVCYVTFHCTFLFRFTVISAFSRSIRSERTVFPCSVLDN